MYANKLVSQLRGLERQESRGDRDNSFFGKSALYDKANKHKLAQESGLKSQFTMTSKQALDGSIMKSRAEIIKNFKKVTKGIFESKQLGRNAISFNKNEETNQNTARMDELLDEFELEQEEDKNDPNEPCLLD